MHVMIDLETLDVRPSAVILSIGAVAFNRDGLGEEFYQTVYAEGQDAIGRTEAASTVAWWQQQSEEARRVFTDPGRVKLAVALERFSVWCGRLYNVDAAPIILWGNGSDFDNTILASAYGSCGYLTPWKFHNNRCYRTLKNLNIPLTTEQGIARAGTHHNALDDAKYQAHYCLEYLKMLDAAGFQQFPKVAA